MPATTPTNTATMIDKTRMANLRLDTRDGAFGARPGGPAVVPGDPRKSKLYQRITSTNAAQRMPLGGQLSATQIETIRTWIEQGATWEAHWSFVPAVRPEVPAVKNRVRNPIDNFILARLDKEGLRTVLA